jgi:hypothetical protein
MALVVYNNLQGRQYLSEIDARFRKQRLVTIVDTYHRQLTPLTFCGFGHIRWFSVSHITWLWDSDLIFWLWDGTCRPFSHKELFPNSGCTVKFCKEKEHFFTTLFPEKVQENGPDDDWFMNNPLSRRVTLFLATPIFIQFLIPDVVQFVLAAYIWDEDEPHEPHERVTIMATSWNITRYREGMGAILFNT